MDKSNISTSELKKLALKVRLKTLEVLGGLGFGHVGGSMSVTELITALYFGDIMNVDPSRPGWEDRDWLIMSKGHAGPTLYTVLAMKGYFPVSELDTLNQGGTPLALPPSSSAVGKSDSNSSISSSASLGRTGSSTPVPGSCAVANKASTPQSSSSTSGGPWYSQDSGRSPSSSIGICVKGLASSSSMAGGGGAPGILWPIPPFLRV